MGLKTLADSILNAASDAIVATDAKGTITFWNRGAERIFGFTQAEAVGQSLDMIIPERLRARHWAGFYRTMRTGESRYGEGDLLAAPGLRKDGTQISLEFTIAEVLSGGERIGLAAILRDVSKRFEEMRELRRRLSALGQS